jgi:hypothetical protein
MESFELIYVCGTAFIWVFAILLLLAVAMRVIMLIFPEKQQGPDAAVIAALSVVLPFLYPGTKITEIEEKK